MKKGPNGPFFIGSARGQDLNLRVGCGGATECGAGEDRGTAQRDPVQILTGWADPGGG